MRIYIDLGLWHGDLMQRIIEKFPPFDQYIGFEALPNIFAFAEKRFKENKRVKIYQKAAWISDGQMKIYKDMGETKGSSFFLSKTTGNLKKNKFTMVETFDFSKYLQSNFSKDDWITLKINIEGAEYDLVEHMIETCSIDYINQLFCAWHYHKLAGFPYGRHIKLIKKLNSLGFPLKGSKQKDPYNLMRKDFSNRNIRIPV